MAIAYSRRTFWCLLVMIPTTTFAYNTAVTTFPPKNFDPFALLQFSTDRHKILTRSYQYIKEQYAGVPHSIFNIVAILNWSNGKPRVATSMGGEGNVANRGWT